MDYKVGLTMLPSPHAYEAPPHTPNTWDHLNHSHTWDPCDSHMTMGFASTKWTRLLDRGLILFFFNVKLLNLCATNHRVGSWIDLKFDIWGLPM